jgi:hypothetical protein
MLKATITCSCGCKYELLSTSKHETVQCPNCSEVFKESAKLVNILETFASINLEDNSAEAFLSDKIFSRQDLQLVTASDFEILKT